MATGSQIEALERLVHESVGRVDAIAPDALRALMPALQQARDELRKDLQSWLDNAPDGSERFTAYQRAQALRALEATFERIEQLQPAMAGALRMGRIETGALAVSNLSNEVTRLHSIFGGGALVMPQIDTAAIIADGKRLLWKRHENSAKRYAGDLGTDIKHRLAVSLAKGDTFNQAVLRLRGSAPFKAMISANDPSAASHGVADAMFSRWRHWADRLVRTENMHAYNVQHDASIEHVNANRGEDEEEYLRRWDATADKVTCPLCRELDRTLATIGGEFKGGIKSPPRHPYCRCVVLAWLARWGHFKGEAPSKDDKGRDIAPTPEKPPPEPKRPPAATTAEAWQRGDHERAREIVQEQAEAMGMVPKSGTKTNPATLVKALPTNIGGYRKWDGTIEISTDSAARAKEFVDAYTADPDGVRSKIAAYRLQRAEINAGARQGMTPDAIEGGRLHTRAASHHVLYHEAAHGYGPTVGRAYVGEGAKIEEVTTEMASRRMFRDRYGIDLNPHIHENKVTIGGAYGAEIHEYINRTRVLLGPDTTYERARTVLERASVDFKKLPENGKLDLKAEFDATIKRAGAQEAKEREQEQKRVRAAAERSARRKGVAKAEPQAEPRGDGGARATTGQPRGSSAGAKPPVDSLPQGSKSGKVGAVNEQTQPRKIIATQLPSGDWVAHEEGKKPNLKRVFSNIAYARTEAEAIAEGTKRAAEDAARKDRKAAEERAKAERIAARAKAKADKEAGLKPIPFDPTARDLPPGAQLGVLRRRGLIERVDGKWRLNERGVRFYLDKQAKESAIIDCTCQICSRTLALHNGRVSLHGYERPGYGFIQGACRGSQRKPWEVSKDAVGEWIAELRGMVARARELLDSVPGRTEYGVEERAVDEQGSWLYDMVRGKRVARMRIVTVTEADPRFAKARADYVTGLEDRIRRLESEIKTQTSRAAGWSPDAAWIKRHGASVK
jgi:hypothetical protein